MKPASKKEFYKPDYPEVKVKALEFIEKFTDPSIIDFDEKHGKSKYMIELVTSVDLYNLK